MSHLLKLSLARSGAPSAPVRALFVHGLLGRGANLASLARAVEALPQLRGSAAAVADLRGHGGSTALRLPAPHTLAAAAADVARSLAAERVSLLVGHSLGGKVLLALASDAAAAAALVRTSPAARVDVVVLDSFPGAATALAADADADVSSVRRVLDLVASAPAPLPSRRWVADACAARGLDAALAAWLASCTTREGSEDGALRWAFDPAVARALYDDYVATDAWPALLAGSPVPGLNVHVVMASRSARWADADTAARVRAAVDAQAARDAAAATPPRGRVTFTRVEAGHWCHVDAPDACLRAIEASLR